MGVRDTEIERQDTVGREMGQTIERKAGTETERGRDTEEGHEGKRTGEKQSNTFPRGPGKELQTGAHLEPDSPG